jgi:hypothetical protein
VAIRTTESLATAYDRAKQIYRQSRADLVNFRNLLSGSSVPADIVFNIARNPDIRVGQLAPIAALPGIIEYARSVGAENDPTYDPVAEFQAWRTALFAIRDHILSTFPVDANGWLLFLKFNVDGTTQVRQFTGAQVTPLITLIDAALATFD